MGVPSKKGVHGTVLEMTPLWVVLVSRQSSNVFREAIDKREDAS
jgi:hypothetical protein